MRYWWVNQNQTYRHEVPGRYLWSPKRKANGQANAFYDFMREVAPGDVVLSFADTRIKAIGIARSNAYEAPKPLEFGQTGAYWEQIGWRVDVGFIELRRPIRPSEYMDVLAPLLPSKYAPLRSIGTGLQSVYLTRLPEALAAALIDLIGVEARDIIRGHLLLEVTGSRTIAAIAASGMTRCGDWIPAYAGMTSGESAQLAQQDRKDREVQRPQALQLLDHVPVAGERGPVALLPRAEHQHGIVGVGRELRDGRRERALLAREVVAQGVPREGLP